MRSKLIISIILLMCGCTTENNPVEQQPSPTTYAPGQIIVGFQHGVSQEAAEELIRSLGITSYEIDAYDFIRTVLITIPVGYEQEWIARFKQHPEVAFAQLNHYVTGRLGRLTSGSTRP